MSFFLMRMSGGFVYEAAMESRTTTMGIGLTVGALSAAKQTDVIATESRTAEIFLAIMVDHPPGRVLFL
jgi:hypothetical protein